MLRVLVVMGRGPTGSSICGRRSRGDEFLDLPTTRPPIGDELVLHRLLGRYDDASCRQGIARRRGTAGGDKALDVTIGCSSEPHRTLTRWYEQRRQMRL